MRRVRWFRVVLALLAVAAVVRLALILPGMWRSGSEWARCEESDGAWSSGSGGVCRTPAWCLARGGAFVREGQRWACAPAQGPAPGEGR